MPLFLSGFLPKGSQQLACQLLNCLFATDIKGINYLFIKILLLLFLIALGFNLTTLHMCLGHGRRGCGDGCMRVFGPMGERV